MRGAERPGCVFLANCLLGLALVLSSPRLHAEAPCRPTGEQQLLEAVTRLEKRVAELERELGRLTAAGATEGNTHANGEAPGPGAQPQAGPEDLRVFWRRGLRFETQDKRFELKVGGRLQCDWAFFDQDERIKAAGDEDDGAEFRRARINFEGRIYDNVLFRTEYDFAGNSGEAKFKDVYVAVTGLPLVGTLKVGHFREPFGLERSTGISDHTFMELPLPAVFAPNRNLGVMAHDHALKERLTWAVGAFKDVDDFPSDDDSDEDQGFAVTGRLTGLPWYEQDGRRLLHLGIAYSHRNPDGAVIGWRVRPEAHLANYYLNTESFEGYRFLEARMDDVDLWDAEAAFIYGPWLVQGEYARADVETTFSRTRHLDGYYVQTSCFLTGEHRPYKTAHGVFGRVVPKRDFSLQGERGWGAWELALRYSCLDLEDGPIRGGEERNYTAGLNWYLNPSTRLMLNYVRATIDHGFYKGDLDVLQTRFQVDF